MIRLLGLLALPLTLALIVFILLAALQSFARGRPDRGRRMLRADALIASGYFVVLLLASVTSRERVLAPGQERFLCDLDCDLALSVARVMPLRAEHAGQRAFAVTVHVRSDAARVVMHVPPLRVWVADQAGHVYDPAAGRDVRYDLALPPGARGDIVLRFETAPAAQDLRLAISSGGLLSKFVIGDEESFLHKRTLLALPEVMAEAR